MNIKTDIKGTLEIEKQAKTTTNTRQRRNQNGGVCVIVGGGPVCACPTGWIGTNCQTGKNEYRAYKNRL